ncbi:unnamed protein product [Echinostoma caproni]|uniref:NUC153 domain-containing protein n=1 Tax=Echinostoma caproni TaxID=27848 RepID=A0A183AK88_9TREM|nr:unnamed protein product [Echinostoma caproni]
MQEKDGDDADEEEEEEEKDEEDGEVRFGKRVRNASQLTTIAARLWSKKDTKKGEEALFTPSKADIESQLKTCRFRDVFNGGLGTTNITTACHGMFMYVAPFADGVNTACKAKVSNIRYSFK